MRKIIFLLLFLLIILLVILCFNKFKNKTISRFINNSPVNNQHTDIVYLFWTGGYDSTFRLCQLLIDEKKKVQPIYISAIIDNEEHKNTRRKSTKQEIDSMNLIKLKLNEYYPFTKKKLLPLINIKKIKIDNDINYAISNLHKKKRMRRPICQYNALAQVSRDLNRDVEMSVEYAPQTSMMFKNIAHTLYFNNNTYRIKNNLEKDDKDLYIFKNCTFPTINYSKEKMLDIAKNGGYSHILNYTWSCWYPKNNKPCGKCIMCRERII